MVTFFSSQKYLLVKKTILKFFSSSLLVVMTFFLFHTPLLMSFDVSMELSKALEVSRVAKGFELTKS